MDFYEVIENRRSVRKYKDTPVARETVERILEAGRKAPSWKNRQCWRYVVVSDPEIKKMLGQIVANPSEACYEQAPYVIAVCAEPSDSGTNGGKEYYMTDCGISMEHVALAATAEGLGSCWVGYFPENQVRALLGAPKDVRVIALMPLGYADEAPEARPRQTMEEMIYWDRWEQR